MEPVEREGLTLSSFQERGSLICALIDAETQILIRIASKSQGARVVAGTYLKICLLLEYFGGWIIEEHFLR